MPLKASLAKQTWETAWVQLYSKGAQSLGCACYSLLGIWAWGGSRKWGMPRCLSIFDNLNLFSLFFWIISLDWCLLPIPFGKYLNCSLASLVFSRIPVAWVCTFKVVPMVALICIPTPPAPQYWQMWMLLFVWNCLFPLYIYLLDLLCFLLKCEYWFILLR